MEGVRKGEKGVKGEDTETRNANKVWPQNQSHLAMNTLTYPAVTHNRTSTSVRTPQHTDLFELVALTGNRHR